MEVVTVKILEKVSVPWSWKLKRASEGEQGNIHVYLFFIAKPSCAFEYIQNIVEMLVSLHMMIEKLTSLKIYILLR
jgi:hypothetical protein